MSETRDIDKLDRLLRHDAQLDIPDEGFTKRVLAALPPAAARKPRAWLQPALVLGSAAIGSALAAAFAGTSIPQGFLDLAEMRGLTPAAITGLAMTAALILSALVLAADD
jgi:hypothetical protein